MQDEYVYPDYFKSLNSIKPKLELYSSPIAVEGAIYSLYFRPHGELEGKGTHLSLGVVRDRVDVLE